MSHSLPSPYKGLGPFEEQDADFFFGRETDTELITANLLGAPLTLFYAPSGVGKSSVLNAGVLPKLRKRPDVIVAVLQKWQDDPVARLKAVIQEAARGRDIAFDTAGSLLECLRGFFKAARESSSVRLLTIILDQFEEYFLYPEFREGFATQFSEIVDRQDLPVNILISIREDCLAMVDRFENEIPGLFENGLRMDYLDREAGRRAIVEPIKRFVARPEAPQISIQPELVDEVLDQVAWGRIELEEGSPRATLAGQRGKIETSYLQLVMARVWKQTPEGSTRLRVETLGALGGAKKIIQGHVDEAMESLSRAETDLAAKALRALVTPSGTKIALSVDDLQELTGGEKTELQTVLQKLASGEARILRGVGALPNGSPRYEIFHDLLAAPILAWRRSHEKLMREKIWRRRVGVSTAVALVFLLLAGVAFFQKRRAVQAELKARSRELATRAQLEGKAEPGRLPLGALLALESLRVQPSSEADFTLRNYLALLPLPLTPLLKLDSLFQALAFSPNGHFLATASGNGTFAMWEASTGKQIWSRAGHRDTITAIQFSGDGSRFATASVDKTARVWNTLDGKPLSDPLTNNGTVWAVQFDKSTNLLTAASKDGLKLWVLTNNYQSPITLQTGTVTVLESSPEGNYLASVSSNLISIFETGTWRQIASMTNDSPNSNSSKVVSIKFNHNGLYIASGDSQGALRFWGTTNGENILSRTNDAGIHCLALNSTCIAAGDANGKLCVWRLDAGKDPVFKRSHSAVITAMAFSPGGLQLGVASDDSTARIWSILDGTELVRVVHEQPVKSIAFNPDGRSFATGSWDDTVRMWETNGYSTVLPPMPTEPRLASELCPSRIAFSADGKYFAVAGPNNDATVIEAANGREVATFHHDSNVRDVAFNTISNVLATACKDGVWLWNLTSHTSNRIWTGEVTAVGFSTDGHRLAAASKTDALVFDFRSGRLIHKYPHSRSLSALTFGDQRWLATAASQSYAQLWDLNKEQSDFQFPHDTNCTVKAVALSGDGEYLATAGGDLSVRIWETGSQKQVRRLILDESQTPYSVDFSPDREYVAVGTANGLIRVWHWSTGREVARIQAGSDTTPVSAVKFSSDGHLLASAAHGMNPEDNMARLWLWQAADLSREASKRLTRNLTPKEWETYLPGQPYHKTRGDLP